MDLLNQVLQLFVRFATIGGGLWLVWGAVTCGGLHRSHAQHDRRRWRRLGHGRIAVPGAGDMESRPLPVGGERA